MVKLAVCLKPFDLLTACDACLTGICLYRWIKHSSASRHVNRKGNKKIVYEPKLNLASMFSFAKRSVDVLHFTGINVLTLTMSDVMVLSGISLGSCIWASCSSATIHGKSYRGKCTNIKVNHQQWFLICQQSSSQCQTSP